MRYDEVMELAKERFRNLDKIHVLKLSVIFLDLVLFVIALFFIYVGFTEWIDFKYSFMSDIFYTVPVSCIIVGCLLLAAFGLCTYGVVEEKLPYIVIYSGILVICASIEFGACFLLSDFREMGVEAKVNIRTSFATLIEEYDPTTGVETLDILQPIFKCCGVKGHEDWTYERVPQRLIDLGYWANPLFPQSCCEYASDDYGEQFCVPGASDLQWMHPIGCEEAFSADLQLKSQLFVQFSNIASGVMVVSALVAGWLTFEIRKYRQTEKAFAVYCNQYTKQSKLNSIFFRTVSK